VINYARLTDINHVAIKSSGMFSLERKLITLVQFYVTNINGRIRSMVQAGGRTNAKPMAI